MKKMIPLSIVAVMAFLFVAGMTTVNEAKAADEPVAATVVDDAAPGACCEANCCCVVVYKKKCFGHKRVYVKRCCQPCCAVQPCEPAVCPPPCEWVPIVAYKKGLCKFKKRVFWVKKPCCEEEDVEAVEAEVAPCGPCTPYKWVSFVAYKKGLCHKMRPVMVWKKVPVCCD